MGFSYISSISPVDSIPCMLDQFIFFSFIPRRIDRRSSKCWRKVNRLLDSFTTIWRDYMYKPFGFFGSVCAVVLYATSFKMFKLRVNAPEKSKVCVMNSKVFAFQSFAADVRLQ